MSKVIISCAVTGSAHTPTMSDALPITLQQIAEQSIAAAAAGAAILHLHARIAETGMPTGDPDVYARFLPVIRQQTDAVINITTGGSATMTVKDRLAAAARFKPEMCSLNMGSLNFAFSVRPSASPAGSMIGKRPMSSIPTIISSATRFET
jgi:uncharacterized protein (DUF849 family)